MNIKKEIWIQNGLIGRNVFDGSHMVVPLNDIQMNQATDRSEFMNVLWSEMCASVLRDGGPLIEGHMNIHYIIINGVAKDFH